MNVDALTPKELAQELGLLRCDGEIELRGVADLFRAAIARWGLSKRRDVLKYVREHLEATSLSCDIEPLLQHLCAIGECAEVYVNGERYIAPNMSRWLRLTPTLGAYLSVTTPPDGLDLLTQEETIVRRFVLDDHAEALLTLAQCQEVLLDDWLTPMDYHRHLARHLDGPGRGDTASLSVYWDTLVSVLDADGALIEAESTLRIVAGESGAYFGRHDSTRPDGRWTETIPADGVWCGCRSGYSERHWIPVLVRCEEGARRIVDLYDWDEWHWAQIARELAQTSEAWFQLDHDRLILNIPLPSQLVATLDLFGARVSGWTWAWPEEAPSPIELISKGALKGSDEPARAR